MAIPNTFEESMALPETARFNAGLDKKNDIMGVYNLCDLVANTSAPTGQQAISSRLVYTIKTDNSWKGRVAVQAWGQVTESDCGAEFAPVWIIQSTCMAPATAVETL